KTERSNRFITLPADLAEKLYRYLKKKRRLDSSKRVFTMSKSFLHSEMNRGSMNASVKRIRIHDLRHSHVSLLISLGFTPVDIAGRLGHESISITLHYAHMFPTRQLEMAQRLNMEITRSEN
ncbi:site-specific integrase, partial [Neglecta sp. X4]